MEDSWKVLMDAGLPDGPPRPRPKHLDNHKLRAAVQHLSENFDLLGQNQIELLCAYLKGWRHHWPKRFAEILGPAGERCHQQLEDIHVDANRYLKLRRIAIENLSGAL